MEWTEIPPIIAAVAAVGLLIVAVVNLCSNLLSKAIDKQDARLGEAINGQGKLLEQYETSNGKEHARLEGKIDKVNETLGEVRDIVLRLDERQQAAERREQERRERGE